MAKIFYRERTRVGEGDRQPRFAVVGVQGTDMTFFQFHLRKSELDTIAQAIGADLVMLPRGSGEQNGKEGSAKKRGTGPRKSKTARRSASG